VDLGWEGDRFDKARDTLIAAGMIEFDPATEEYWICRWFRHNPPMNEKHMKGVVYAIDRLNSDRIQEIALEALEVDHRPFKASKQPAGRTAAMSHPSDLAATKFLNGEHR
jgi:hypothetical protein